MEGRTIMLSLGDPRWKDLNHRGWTSGARYHLDPGAPFVPDELARLLKDPTDIERFDLLWPYLCSEGTAWAAAYAVTPYAIELARHVPPDQRLNYLYFIGLVAMCSCPQEGESFAIKPYLAESYRRSLTEAILLIAELLVIPYGLTETRYLLAAIAALKGHVKLGRVLNYLDSICAQCPRCGEDVFPEELQDAVRD
jgi:hypothetical protein